MFRERIAGGTQRCNSELTPKNVGLTLMNATIWDQNSFYQVVRPTTIIESVRPSSQFACEVTLASETFQHTGSFKFRAAYQPANNVSNLRQVIHSIRRS